MATRVEENWESTFPVANFLAIVQTTAQGTSIHANLLTNANDFALVGLSAHELANGTGGGRGMAVSGAKLVGSLQFSGGDAQWRARRPQ